MQYAEANGYQGEIGCLVCEIFGIWKSCWNIMWEKWEINFQRKTSQKKDSGAETCYRRYNIEMNHICILKPITQSSRTLSNGATKGYGVTHCKVLYAT